MTPQELAQAIRQSLYNMAFNDVINASVKGNAKLAGFILGACFIDAMASFRYGVTKGHTGGSSQRFKDFVKDYLPMYNESSLYTDLRCGLVHSYAEGGTYIFTDANKGGSHQQQLANGKILLNLEDFCKDIENAYLKLENDILNDNNIYNNAISRVNSMGLMVVRPLTSF